jgi:hypothetical protein
VAILPSVTGNKKKLSCFPNKEKNGIFARRIARSSPIKTLSEADIAAKRIDRIKAEVKSSELEKSGLKKYAPEIPLIRNGNKYSIPNSAIHITILLVSFVNFVIRPKQFGRPYFRFL